MSGAVMEGDTEVVFGDRAQGGSGAAVAFLQRRWPP